VRVNPHYGGILGDNNTPISINILRSYKEGEAFLRLRVENSQAKSFLLFNHRDPKREKKRNQ